MCTRETLRRNWLFQRQCKRLVTAKPLFYKTIQLLVANAQISVSVPTLTIGRQDLRQITIGKVAKLLWAVQLNTESPRLKPTVEGREM